MEKEQQKQNFSFHLKTNEMKNIIHPTATVHPSTILEGVEIGPYVFIGEGAFIGKGTVIKHHAYIEKWAHIGEKNVIYPFVVLSTPPQDISYKGEKTYVRIGNNNIIREFSTIHRASGEGKTTYLGDNNYLMAYSHIAHNCNVGNHVAMANCASLAGHVKVEDYVIVGGLVGVHQFCRIGESAIIGACSKVVKDVLPFVKADGHPLKVYGLNTIGLKRRGFPDEKIKFLKKAYKIIFRENLMLKEAIEILQKEMGEKDEIRKLVDFIKNSKRGIHK